MINAVHVLPQVQIFGRIEIRDGRGAGGDEGGVGVIVLLEAVRVRGGWVVLVQRELAKRPRHVDGGARNETSRI